MDELYQNGEFYTTTLFVNSVDNLDTKESTRLILFTKKLRLQNSSKCNQKKKKNSGEIINSVCHLFTQRFMLVLNRVNKIK